MCAHVSVWDMYMSAGVNKARRGYRIPLSRGYRQLWNTWLGFRQGAFFATVYARLAGKQASGCSRTYNLYLVVETLGLQTCTTTSKYVGLGIWTQVIVLAWQMFYPLSHSLGPCDAFSTKFASLSLFLSLPPFFSLPLGEKDELLQFYF